MLALGLELKNLLVVLLAIIVFYFVKEKKRPTPFTSPFKIIMFWVFLFFCFFWNCFLLTWVFFLILSFISHGLFLDSFSWFSFCFFCLLFFLFLFLFACIDMSCVVVARLFIICFLCCHLELKLLKRGWNFKVCYKRDCLFAQCNVAFWVWYYFEKGVKKHCTDLTIAYSCTMPFLRPSNFNYKLFFL